MEAAPLPSDELRAARTLIMNEQDWIKGGGDFARTAEGKTCWPWAKDAASYCAYGAIVRTSGGRFGPLAPPTRAMGYLTLAAQTLGYNTVVYANAHGNHADVLKIYDVAIADADADEAKAIVQTFLREGQEFAPRAGAQASPLKPVIPN